MASELPYFRYTVQEWQNGKISLESYELKGLFIDVCGYYWINNCDVTLATLKKRFSNAIPLLEQLIDLGILKHEARHDKVEIDFLMKQLCELSELRKHRQIAGSKGGKAKAKLKQKDSYKDKIDNNKDKIITINEVYAYFEENGYTKEAASKFYNYYDVAGWKDSKGNKVKNWKQKAQAVWFKPENKIQVKIDLHPRF